MRSSINTFLALAALGVASLINGAAFGAEGSASVEEMPSFQLLDGMAEASPAACEQWPGCTCVKFDVVAGLSQRFSLTRSCPHPAHEDITLISNFDQHGQEIDRGQMKNGKAQGLWVSWYPSGELNGFSYFEDGKPQGEYTVWYPSGALLAEGHHHSSGEHGDHFRYSESGEVEHHSVWHQGKLINDLSASYRSLEAGDQDQ